MRYARIAVGLAVVCAFCGLAVAQDAVKADPKHYSVVTENAYVRVLKAHYGPHEKSVMHSHPAGAAVPLTDAKGRFTMPDGKTQDMEMKAGQAIANDPQVHLPENIGDKAFDILIIEIKGPGGSGGAKTSAAKAPAKK